MLVHPRTVLGTRTQTAVHGTAVPRDCRCLPPEDEALGHASMMFSNTLMFGDNNRRKRGRDDDEEYEDDDGGNGGVRSFGEHRHVR